MKGYQVPLLGFPTSEVLIISIISIAAIVIAAMIVKSWLARRMEQFAGQEMKKSKRLEEKISRLVREYEELREANGSELARLNLDLNREIVQRKQAEEKALASEERFRNTVDHLQEGLAIIEGGEIVYINQSGCKILGGLTEEGPEIMARRLELLDPGEKERLIRSCEDAFHGYDTTREDEYWIDRQDGDRRCIHNRYSISKARGIPRYFVVSSDITDQVLSYRMLEQAVEERTQELSTVLEISKKITSTLELEPLLQVILEQIRSVIPYSGATIFTLQDEQLEVAAWQSPGTAGPTDSIRESIPYKGAYRQVIQQQKVLILDDLKGDTPLARALSESSEGLVRVSFAHAHSWIGIPLTIKDKVIGLLSLTHEKPNFYTQIHIRLALAIANQVAVAMENARLYERAYDLATVEERQRIACELHDSVTQLLYGICLYSTAVNRSVLESDVDLSEQILAEIKENALKALREMRLLINELHPPLLDDFGLVAALQSSLESVQLRTGLQTELVTDGIQRLSGFVEGELYRVALEALNNLVKYANAKRVRVDLHRVAETVFLEICDNGVGFDLEKARNSGGLGLRNMEQRVKKLGGTLTIESTPGSGTRLRVAVPIQESARSPAEISTKVEV